MEMCNKLMLRSRSYLVRRPFVKDLKQGSCSWLSIRTVASASADNDNKGPSRLIYQPTDPFAVPQIRVHGVTKEVLASNPDIAEFYRTNFGGPASHETAHQSKKPSSTLEIQVSDEIFARLEKGDEVSEQELFGDNLELLQLSGDYTPPPELPYYKSIEAQDNVTTESNSSRNNHKKSQRKYPRNIRPLSAYLRNVEGSRSCRELREKQRLIPGLLYGGDPDVGIASLEEKESAKLQIMTPHSEIQRERNLYRWNFESRVYQLTIWESPQAEQQAIQEGRHVTDSTPGVVQQLLVVPSDYQKHPFLEKHTCLNYLRYHPKRSLNLPIQLINEEESPALKRDGFVVPIKRFLPCTVEEGYDIPEALQLDCRGVQVKDKLRLNRVILPEGIKVSKRLKHPAKWLHGTIFGKSSGSAGAGDDSEEAAA